MKRKKIRLGRDLWKVVLICICIVLILIGGGYYVVSLRDNLMDQMIANVLTVTQQQRQAFDNFILEDRERLHSFSTYFSRVDSTDVGQILDNLDAFSEIDADYTVVNLETGEYYHNKSDGVHKMAKDELGEYQRLEGADIREPYDSLVSDEMMFGYYESFTFADGVPGLFQKGYDRSKVSAEFSLLFYDGEGMGYVTDRHGEILLRPTRQSGEYAFDNIFDLVPKDKENQSKIDDFVKAVEHQETGTLIFGSGDGDYVYTYVPVESVEEWYLISVVPLDAVMKEADHIIRNSQSTMLVLLIAMLVAMVFCFLIWWNREKIREKDEEIEYNRQQFEIFSTYLSNNTNDVYMMISIPEHKVEYVSPNVERVLGVSEEDVLRDVTAFGRSRCVTEDSIGFEELDKMQPGDSLNTVLCERLNEKTQEHKWFQETVYCVMMQEERKVIIYLSDRTQERKTQDTLTEALDMAQVANRAKSAFLGNVSHDIRTPMNAIMGLVTLLQQEVDNPERVLDYTYRIEAASQHLLGLINDVLDMSKIEGGNATLNITEINMAEIIDELNVIIRPQARAKEQDFKIYASSFAHEHLLGDKLRINQILINILSNAVKYTHKGGQVELHVNEMPQVAPEYSHVQFIIKDNGQGMTDDYQKVIFDPFTREQNASTDQIQGTGLGMAITKSLVDLMGGVIKVNSAVGAGSTFTVELELRIQEGQSEERFWDDNGLTRMIVADDDEYICKNIVKAMASTGVEVHYTTSGREAVNMMRTAREAGDPFDLILLDWKMPDLDGLETARLIRKNYSEQIPILLFTAHDWSEIEQEAMEIGVSHFLPKPFFLHSFKEAIQRVMDRQKGEKKPSVEKEEENVLTGRNVLVVDDIEVNRMILVKILGTLGAVCDMAENGQVAVDMFNGSVPGEYDIIFMDVQMPVLNGYEATKAIRSSGHPSAESVAIIAMTANAFVDDVREALASGMDAHVSKPIVLDQLKNTIREVLEYKGML